MNRSGQVAHLEAALECQYKLGDDFARALGDDTRGSYQALDEFDEPAPIGHPPMTSIRFGNRSLSKSCS